MAYIKVEITISKILGCTSHTDEILVGNYNADRITKEAVIELFKRMVNIFRYYNRMLKKGEM